MGRAVGLLGLALLGCGGGVVTHADALPPPPPGQGFLQVVCDPPDAELFVDGHFHGRVDGYPEGVVRLTAGPHRIRLRKAGHYAWYARIEAGAEPSRVAAHLVDEVRSEP